MACEHNGSEGGGYNVCFGKCPIAIVSVRNGTHCGVESLSTTMDGGATLYDHNAIGHEPSKWPSSFFQVQMGNATNTVKIIGGLPALANYELLVSADQKLERSVYGWIKGLRAYKNWLVISRFDAGTLILIA